MRSNNTNKWDAQERKPTSTGFSLDQIIPINGMLKNPVQSLFSLRIDQIIPINGMLKNSRWTDMDISWDQIIPINGMLKNVEKR